LQEIPEEAHSILRLDLDANGIGASGCKALASICLPGSPLASLEYLALAGNNVGAVGCEALISTLANGGLLQLEHCDLNGNTIGDSITRLGEAIADNLATLSNVRKLFLDRNEIVNDGLVGFSKAIRRVPNLLPKLYELWLSNNAFGDPGAVALCEALGAGAMPNLGDLRLQYNAIGDATIQALVSAIERGALRNCWYLGFNDTELTDHGLEMLRECLIGGGLPKLEFFTASSAQSTSGTMQSVQDVLTARRQVPPR